MIHSIKRGDIYLINFGQKDGAEQGGTRPAVIIQNDKGNQHSPTVIACPLTSQSKKNLPSHMILTEEDGVNKRSVLLCEQITTIDKSKLQRKLGVVKDNKIEEINRAIRISLGME